MICNQCGKEFDVLYPDLWRYKRWNKWSCSWHCLRADEKGEELMATRLKKDGTPWGKPGPKRTKVETPETGPVQCIAHVTAAEIEEAINRDPEGTQKRLEQYADEQLKLQGGVNYQLKVEEDRKDSEWSYPAIRHVAFGEWYFDRDHNRIDWRTPEGDEVSFSPDGWKRLMAEILPKVMKDLGVTV